MILLMLSYFPVIGVGRYESAEPMERVIMEERRVSILTDITLMPRMIRTKNIGKNSSMCLRTSGLNHAVVGGAFAFTLQSDAPTATLPRLSSCEAAIRSWKALPFLS